jgi:asparagine synthase (glutamine-hydrolysing)
MLAQDHPYIAAALACDRSLVHHAVPADDLLDFDDYLQVPLLDEPSPQVHRWPSMAALARVAAAAGADTLLSGDGADHLFAHPASTFIAERLSQGHWREAWRLATAYSLVSGQSARRLVAEALTPRWPFGLRDGLGPFVRGWRTPFESLNDRTLPPWVTAEASRRYRLRQRIQDRQMPASREGAVIGESITYAAGDWFCWYASLPHGVVMCRPYFDPRLVALGLGLPRWVHMQPGRMKPVLAAALHDVLPELILTRSRKAHFGVLSNGLARHREVLDALIQQVPLADELLDRAALRQALEKAALGVYTHVLGVSRLHLALGYVLWMTTRSAWRQRPVPVLAPAVLPSGSRPTVGEG